MTPSVEAIPVMTRSGFGSSFSMAFARIVEVPSASVPWIWSSTTWTALSAPICSAFFSASDACSGPTVSTVTSPSPASVRRSASSMAYSSSSESSPSTPTRSVVLSLSTKVRSAWASGTYLTQTTMFMRPLL